MPVENTDETDWESLTSAHNAVLGRAGPGQAGAGWGRLGQAGAGWGSPVTCRVKVEAIHGEMVMLWFGFALIVCWWWLCLVSGFVVKVSGFVVKFTLRVLLFGFV